METDPKETEQPQARRQAAGPRLSLTDQLNEFGFFVAELVAPKLASRWRERVTRRWGEEQATFEHKAATTKKLYGSKFRRMARDAVEGQIDFTSDAFKSFGEADQRTALMKAIRAMPDKRRAHVIELLPTLLPTPEATLKEIKRTYNKKVVERHHNLAVVEDWQKLAVALRMMLRSNDPYEKALGIIGCTGRRFREVLQSGVFGPVRGFAGKVRVTQRFALTFSGQLKTREAEGSRFGETYVIPTIAPANEVLAAINALRQSAEGREWMSLSPTTLNSRVGQAMRHRLATHSRIVGLWPPGVDLVIKGLRDFYAEVAYVSFAPANISKNAYFARILGHGEDDLRTGLSYQKMALSGHEDTARAEWERTMDAVEAQENERRAAGLPVADDVGEDDDDDDIPGQPDESSDLADDGADDAPAEPEAPAAPKTRQRKRKAAESGVDDDQVVDDE